MNSFSILPVLLIMTVTPIDSVNLRSATTDYRLCEEVEVEIRKAVADRQLKADFGQRVINDCYKSIER